MDRPETKKEKRRRDIANRVARINAEVLDNEEKIYEELYAANLQRVTRLLPAPRWHSVDDYPGEYALALHKLSVDRSSRIMSERLLARNEANVMKRLYEAEISKIEEEYANASKAILSRLLRGIEERKVRLLEDREYEPPAGDAFGDANGRGHGTRRLRATGNVPLGDGGGDDSGGKFYAIDGSAAVDGSTEWTPQEDLTKEDAIVLAQMLMDPLAAEGEGQDKATAVTLAADMSTGKLQLGATQPPVGEHMRRLVQPMLRLFSVQSSLASAPASPSASKPQRAQVGLPPLEYTVQPGNFSLMGKSTVALSGLSQEEVDADIQEMQRKRPKKK